MTPSDTDEPSAVAPPPAPRVLAEMYRVVERVVDDSGRLTDRGAVWHPDLARVRAWAELIARTSVSRQIWIASTTNRRLERIRIP